MKLTTRLYEYLSYLRITAYEMERTCGLSNGYIGKQDHGKGSIGSNALAKIEKHYPDLNLIWLITGKGHMLSSQVFDFADNNTFLIKEELAAYHSLKDALIDSLKQQVAQLQKQLEEKDMIIALLRYRK
ncbi:MAG: hypothetical protein IKD55_02460 [Sediminibacterium sp.]|jgi:hypothetical protein|nr:hypothetical protein [Sediminibacterium sp.]MBX9780897.1 hypothetical protein [Chitinophagaceae bacterium]